MEPEIYRCRLKKNYIAILRDLEPKKILGYLYQDSIFDEDDMDEVQAERTRKKQAQLLLTLLDRKGKEGFISLVNALQETQPHLARILTIPPTNEKTEITNQGSIHVQVKNAGFASIEDITNMVKNLRGAEEHSQDFNAPHDGSQPKTADSANTMQSYDDFVKPTKFDLISPLYRPYLSDSVYKMTSSPRGLAVIVNMHSFKPDKDKIEKEEQLEDREGSEVDVKDLDRLFKCLNFHVEIMIDKTENELKSELDEISKRDLSAFDCFVLCIMSHGKEDYFYCYDGGKIQVSIICKIFTDSAKCSTLFRKPKLFFIQACRGKLSDFGRVVSDAPSEHSDDENPESRADKPMFNIENTKHCKKLSTSDNADILKAYSSVEGYTSYRNTGTGSRFIRSIVEQFRQYAGVEDVESMMTRVIKQVNSEGDVSSKQVPKPETTLTKKVFFWPGVVF